MTSERTKKKRGASVFLGFEHSGIYPLKSNPDDIAAWYEKIFDFKRSAEAASCFLSGPGSGRLEIMKQKAGKANMHVAIQVSDFEEAVKVMEAKGIRLRKSIIQPDLKIVYLEEPDPEGNLVHLWWRK